jgi:hypothetical protein
MKVIGTLHSHTILRQSTGITISNLNREVESVQSENENIISRFDNVVGEKAADLHIKEQEIVRLRVCYRAQLRNDNCLTLLFRKSSKLQKHAWRRINNNTKRKRRH